MVLASCNWEAAGVGGWQGASCGRHCSIRCVRFRYGRALDDYAGADARYARREGYAMTVSRGSWILLAASVTILAISVALMQCPSVSGQTQPEPERFWLAGRYDGNRVLIYFDAVHFKGTFPSGAKELAQPLEPGFFDIFELREDYIAQLAKMSGAERFAIGDEYDLLAGNGTIVPVTLTTLVGSEGDEEVGNDSYIGALASANQPNYLFSTNGYYAVRRHEESDHKFRPATSYAGLSDEPVPFDLQTEMVSLLAQHMTTTATDGERRVVEGKSPAFTVRAFRVAGGGLRYYATAEWLSGTHAATPDFSLAAWCDPAPVLHALAFEVDRNPDLYQLPRILNVVELGRGRTGMIVGKSGEDSSATVLVEYRDGADVAHMRVLQSIGARE